MSALSFHSVTRYSQGGGSQGRLSTFKRNVKKFYGLSGASVENDLPSENDSANNLSVENDLFDMASGKKLRHGSIIAAHIFQFKWRGSLSLFTSLTDINDVRNALLLYKPVEDAFDTARLCIDTGGQTMRFRLLDETLRTTKLADRAVTLRKAAKRETPQTPAEMALEDTFGDLDGRELFFPQECSNRPSKRLLALHGRAALIFAKAAYEVPEAVVPHLHRDMTGSVSDDLRTKVAFERLSLFW
jgi:hypothetical protein